MRLDAKIILFVVGVLGLIALNLLVSFRFGEDSISSHYVDEEEDIVIATNMDKERIIYRNLYTHHQPLPYIFSHWIQKVIPKGDVKTVTIFHRAFISLWSIGWWIILISSFGPLFFVIAFIIELTKLYFLGNFFFAESMVIFPLIYLTTVIIFEKKISSFFCGLCIPLVIFLYAPLWPLMAFYLLILFRRLSVPKMIVGALPVLICVLTYISFPDYLYQTVYTNLIYYVPDALSTSRFRFVSVFLGPFLAIANPVINTSLYAIKIFSLAFIYGLLLSIVRGKYKLVVLAFVFLGMSGYHGSPALHVYYQEFHLIVWYSMLVLLTIFFLSKKSLIFMVVVSIVILTYGRLRVPDEYSVSPVYFTAVTRFFANFRSSLVNIFVASGDSALYRFSNLPMANDFAYYHSWMYKNPYVEMRIEDSFQVKPPVFVYYPPSNAKLDKYLENYVKICHRNAPIYLYLLQKKISEVNLPNGYQICI